MSRFQITRHLEFDAGHRIPNHFGQCRHLLGHRYQIQANIEGKTLNLSGESDEGMLMDFSQIKAIMQEYIIGPWDHCFFVCIHDHALVNFLKTIPNHKTVITQGIPTVENLAKSAFDILSPRIEEMYPGRIQLKQLRLYETPNCWADIYDI
jgi:6-pyruvoyltetrahydropterin/6-carboxytetrahydropterin synthase